MTKKAQKYIPQDIEAKWQAKWEEEKLYQFKLDSDKTPYYNLVELPYPSGDLHLGHWFAFVPPDVHARYNRMEGKNVFFPNGFDAFGLPAENAAIKRHIHPQDWTMQNINTMTKQFVTMGTMIDWSHKVITCLPEYYGWNQWIFIKMFEKGLAYRGKAFTNWCPVDQTVLANENIESGKCWRCGTEVVQKEVEQWFLKITDYADKLIWTDEVKEDWPQSVRDGQNNWIGKSEGAVIEFSVDGIDRRISVFTTRPDTLYGATFLVLAPEHLLVLEITSSEQEKEIKTYINTSSKKTEMERKEMKEKTGVFTGGYAVNPVNNEKLPVYIADYVLNNYGTGAIMAVPAHDTRDFEFAKKHDIEIKEVIKGGETPLENPYVGSGEIINSEEWNGFHMPQDMEKVLDDVEKKGFGKRKATYHLRDWSISRQRYWGTPVPMVHCEKDGIVPVNISDLPIKLPYDVDFAPTGKPPLATATEWVKTTCPRCGGDAIRDAETLDTFFDSAWYYYRYLNPEYKEGPFDQNLSKKLMPVDIYFGGSEHTLGHTLYARFFTKFFKDLGLIDFNEFAKKRVQHGIVLGPDGNRMSKSKGNVVNPDDVVKEYGADTVRLYLCFMMPYEAVAPWDPGAMQGIYRFFRRIWDMSERLEEAELSNEDQYIMNTTIKKVGEDIRDIKFNTAVAALMEWLNHLGRKEKVTISEYINLLLLLAPFAPHFTEEIYQHLLSVSDKKKTSDEKAFKSIHLENWPKYDEKHLQQSEIVVVIQVNGKRRGEVRVGSEKSTVQSEVEMLAKNEVSSYLESGVKKVIFVPGKIINFVV